MPQSKTVWKLKDESILVRTKKEQGKRKNKIERIKKGKKTCGIEICEVSD